MHNSPIGKLNQEKRSIKDRKSRVFDLEHRFTVKPEASDTATGTLERLTVNTGLPPTNPVSNVITTNSSHFVVIEDERSFRSNGLKGSMIEISSSLISSSPKKNEKIVFRTNPISRKSPEVVCESSDLLKNIKHIRETGSKNQKILHKNMNNVHKYEENNMQESCTTLKAKLKRITNKKYSPNK